MSHPIKTVLVVGLGSIGRRHVRIIKELETTGTFKLKKNELRDEAYHLDKVNNDRVFIKKPGTNSYVELDNETYQDISTGSVPF